MRRFYLQSPGLAVALIALVGCGGAQTPGSSGLVPQLRDASRPARSNSPIQHIVVLVQESRTFNDLFVTTKTGKMRVGHGRHAKTIIVKLKESNLEDRAPMNDLYAAYLRAYRDGHMDGFGEVENPDGHREGTAPYQYVNPAQVRPYLTLASDYAIADRMFQTQGSGDFTAHQDLIRGGTEISDSASVIDNPSSDIWGCPAPQGETTNLITTKLKYVHGQGPAPCFTYKTLQSLLDAKSVSWKYYVPDSGQAARDWNAFLAVAAVDDNRTEWDSHISSPETNIFDDIKQSQLPAMSWVVPSPVNSDHPGYAADKGPAWVASVVDAIGESSYWDSTAIVVVWDDWGGFYDPIPPPKLDNQGGPGFRVPMIVVSAYTPQGEVSHTIYGFGSIVRFVEDTWQLGRLGTTDETTKSIGNMFDFHQSPRAFTPPSQ